jgi:hypothetical protein
MNQDKTTEQAAEENLLVEIEQKVRDETYSESAKLVDVHSEFLNGHEVGYYKGAIKYATLTAIIEAQREEIERLRTELEKANRNIEYYKSHFSKERYNDGVYLQKNNDNRDWTAEEWMNEFYEFLKTGEADKIHVEHKPMLNEDQAFSIIWYLQEHFPLLPDNIDQCDVCKGLYNSHSTGYYTENGNEHGNSFCGACDYLAPYENEENTED